MKKKKGGAPLLFGKGARLFVGKIKLNAGNTDRGMEKVMKKAELKEYLQIYSKIVTALKGGKAYTCIYRNNRKQKIIFKEWAYRLPEYIREIIQAEEDVLLSETIEESVVKGRTDREVLSDIPISESSYYRYKRKFEEKLYELFIVDGYVSREEILKNVIMK